MIVYIIVKPIVVPKVYIPQVLRGRQTFFSINIQMSRLKVDK